MKIALKYSAVLLSITLISFHTSCKKKDYVCECTNTTSIPSIPAQYAFYTAALLQPTTTTKTIKGVKKKEAENQCQDSENTISFMGYSGTIKSSCSLK